MKWFFISLLCSVTLLSAATSKQDDKTGLIWQDNAAVAEKEMSYENAIAYCKALKVDGFSDWRLPTLQELISIVDLKRDRPTLKNGFDIRIDERFWTATPYAKPHEKEAWRISFSYGEMEPYQKSREYHVRCVRSHMK